MKVVLPISLKQTRIGFLTLSLKKELVEIHQGTNLLVQCMDRSIGVNACWEWEISLVVEKWVLRLGTIQM